MDLKKIQELIKLVKKNDLGELKVKEGDFAISIKNKGGETVYTTSVATPVVTQAAVSNPKSEIQNQKLQETTKAEVINENIITFRSPMVGTFYRKPGADKEPYVKVGDGIKGGDVLCIIEAMKLFNEIEFDGGEGKIVKILAEDNSPVEYDQPLFLIEKN
jgi:acetyl-CoA carboxylase biotin carboxyl carrier protein